MSEHVSKYFYNGGLNCAETTLRCLIENGTLDLPIETVRMMTGFGGGMQIGSTCGAVVAAVAAIGCLKGRTEPGADREASADAVRKFLEAYQRDRGALTCDEILAINCPEYELKSDDMYRACTANIDWVLENFEKFL